MSADPTPYELLWAESANLRARLGLAEQRAFEQGAAIARLMVEKAHLEAEIGQLRDKRAELVAALEDAEFLLRKIGTNWKEAASMADSCKRSAKDARQALALAKAKEGRP